MLTSADIVDYVKRKISFLPYIDISDEDIMDHIKRYTLREFARFSRLRKSTVLDTRNEWFKTTDKNVFKFYDRQQRTILNIYAVSTTTLFQQQQPMFVGDGINSAIDWLMSKTLTDTVATLLDYEYWQYIPHNKIMLNRYMSASEIVGIEYECAPLITEIPDQYEPIFLDLATAYCKEWIANMRIDNVNSLFGEINVNSSELRQEAQTVMDDFKEKIRKQPPNLYIHVG